MWRGKQRGDRLGNAAWKMMTFHFYKNKVKSVTMKQLLTVCGNKDKN